MKTISNLREGLNNSLRRLENLFGNKYRKFIILGTARTGSTLLRSLLTSHSEVIAFGELFRNLEDIGWDLMPYQEDLQTDTLKKLRIKKPIRFLRQKVFSVYPENINAVGFKLFYYQAQEGHQKYVWEWIQKNQEIRIIHIKRRNYLKTLTSLTKAHQTNKWYKANPRDSDNTLVMLTYEKCLDYFNWLEVKSTYYDRLFAENEKISVYYEDLADDSEAEMKRVQDFLSLRHEMLMASTLKQSNQTLSETISNYHELKQQFVDTPWFTFFED